MDLNSEVELLKSKLMHQDETESNAVRKTLQLLEEDREKLLNTVEPLMKTNKDLQESLEGLANELKQKNNEIKKLRASSVNVKREMEIETVAMETKVDDVRKEFDAEMKEVKKHHKKEISKVRALSSIYIYIYIWSENSSSKSEANKEILHVSFSPFLMFLCARSDTTLPGVCRNFVF
jgi:peptidoglycan hydrolase CwlO-like protein